jgi:hypothetical protein
MNTVHMYLRQAFAHGVELLLHELVFSCARCYLRIIDQLITKCAPVGLQARHPEIRWTTAAALHLSVCVCVCVHR